MKPIGLFPHGTSPYGVQEMAGTVLEWTSSPFSPYPWCHHPELASETPYVQRGGAWRSMRVAVRAADRVHNIFENLRSCSGARLVVDPA
jgi:formylglycine-generating enzyme required for sulfatase activity